MEIFYQKSIVVCLVFLLPVVNLQSTDPDESFCTTLNGREGVCISLSNQLTHCPQLKGYLNSSDKRDWEKLRQSFCSPNIRNGRVCCPLEDDDEGYGEDAIRDTEPDYKTDSEKWEQFSLKATRCGLLGTSNRVFGGNDAYLGQFPWMVRIGYLQEDGEALFSCSGTVIHKRYILTSAHCLLPYRNGQVKLAPVRLAENDDSQNPETVNHSPVYYKDMEIDEIHIHPNYTGNKTSSHDIALIRLKEEIPNLTNDSFIRAICLPFQKEYNLGSQLDEEVMVRKRDDPSKKFRPIVAGWGRADNASIVGSSILQYLYVPVQPSILCRILYANSNFSNKHICAGGEENKSSCWGDSGGPLMYHADITVISSKGKRMTVTRTFQIGIVSYGKTQCAQKGVPVVYTRLRDYLSWIVETVKE